ncbi:hypothetical protein PISMIDRAFT_350007 [Pisolithus microcarpus 441]|uniref:Uncharacterized protein n=1 Tax=Pisolithus microcarpus 441 TaxID=765257 RepID=A0A0C9ZZX5_9AGAM|nr:hypothetical protein PISMIDRAFT_350007 [Pisolithus microcarpus 441]
MNKRSEISAPSQAISCTKVPIGKLGGALYWQEASTCFALQESRGECWYILGKRPVYYAYIIFRRLAIDMQEFVGGDLSASGLPFQSVLCK